MERKVIGDDYYLGWRKADEAIAYKLPGCDVYYQDTTIEWNRGWNARLDAEVEKKAARARGEY